MKYVAPVAEVLAVETVSVLLASQEVPVGPSCPTQTESERD